MARSSMKSVRAWLLLGSILLMAPLAEAIVVAPHYAILDHRNRSGVIYLHNPATEPEEVSISFVFGYPASDSAGDVSIQVIEQPAPDDPSAVGWIHAYPRRMIVGPGQTRAVRLLAQPPADLPEGEYWARAVVHSRSAGAPAVKHDSTRVQVGLTLEVRTVVPVTFRNGDVNTGFVITNIDHETANDSLVTKIGLRRTGNAAFLGTLHLTLVTDSAAVVAESHRQVAVYRELLRRVSLPVAGLPPGDYTLHIRLDTQRSDVEPDLILSAQALETSLEVHLP